MIGRRTSLAALAALMLTCLGFDASAQQNYPQRVIRWVVPFAAGSGTDTVARIIAQHASGILGQQIVIENMGGANGVLAAQNVARAAPDGYTLFFTTNTTHAANPSLMRSLPYDPVADFEPIARVAEAPLALLVNNSIPVNDVTGLIAYARQNPGRLSFGAGSSSAQLSGEMFRRMANIDVLYVPYRSNPQALNDVIGGQISFMFADAMFCISQAREGRVKCLGVTSRNRSRLASDTPSMHEAGVDGFHLTAWFAMFAPARTPKPVIDAIYQALSRTLSDQAVVSRMLATGFEPSLLGPDETATFVQSEIAKWGAIVREAGIEPQ